jgi:dTMP kinase
MDSNNPARPGPLFLTFEGIEGSGKTVQLARTQAYLASKGIPCVVTREPGGTEFGKSLRQLLLDSRGAPREPVTELLLYLADRYQHIKEVVEPSLRAGLTVLSDRYHDATRAYQGAARGVGSQTVDALACTLGIREPDGTILLDLAAEIGLSRARRRNETGGSVDEGRFEAEDSSFHEAVRRAYLELAKSFPERIRRVDAGGPPGEVFSRIAAILDGWFGCRP